MTPVLETPPLWARAARRARRSVVLTVVAIAGLAIYLAWKEGVFTPVEKFHFVAKSAKSLHPGMAVNLSGIRIGQVKSVEILKDRSVQVNLSIFRDKDYLELIRTDSTVRLETGLPIGDSSLEIVSPGLASKAPVAEPGSELKYFDQPQLFDQLGGVVDQLKPVIEGLKPVVEDLDALLKQARQPDGEVQASLKHLDATLARIDAWTPGFMERTDATVGSFKATGDLGVALVKPLTQADGDLQTSLRDLHTAVADLRTALPPLLDDLKAISASVRASATSLEPAVRQVAPQIPAIVEDGRRTAADASDVVGVVKDIGIIRNRINQPVSQPLLPTTPP